MKKNLAILLSAVLLLIAAPLAEFTAFDGSGTDPVGVFPYAKAAYVVDSGDCSSTTLAELPWKLYSDGSLVISLKGDVPVPTSPKDEEGVSVCNYSFEGRTDIKSVKIANGITGIGWDAFRNCTELTGVTIPDSVTSIGDGAFEGCKKLSGVTIPNGVTEIRWGVFSGCTGLKRVTIGEYVTIIGRNAFEGCSGLTEVKIPDGVTEIGDAAFAGCKGLTSISIPYSVNQIGYYAFRDCTGLTSATIGNSAAEISNNAFAGCTKLKNGPVWDRNSPARFGDDSAFYSLEPEKGLCFTRRRYILITSPDLTIDDVAANGPGEVHYGGFGSSSDEVRLLDLIGAYIKNGDTGTSYGFALLADADGDETISAGDARLTLRYSVGLEKDLEDRAVFTMDVDFDNKVTSADARLILRASVRLESTTALVKARMS